MPDAAAHRRQAGRGGAATRAPTAIRPRAASRACAGRMAAYYERRFGVELDPGDARSIATLGSKEGLANLAQAITSPGDIILVPNPSYPIHPFGFIMAGASIRHLPIGRTAQISSPALERAVKHSRAEAAGAGAELPVEPDGAGRRSRFLRARSSSSAATHEHLHPVRPRLCRDLFRRHAAALDPAGAGRQGHRRRVHLDEQDLLHAGLAHRLRRRQQDADRGAGADQILSRLRRLHADPGRRRPRRSTARRIASPRCARIYQAAPRRADRAAWPRPAGTCRARRPRCSPGRRSRRSSPISARWNSPSCC